MREAFERSSSSRFLAFFADPSLIREYPCVPPCGTRVPKNKKSAGECLSVLVRVCLRLSSFFLTSVVCPLISGFWKRLIAQAGLLVKFGEKGPRREMRKREKVMLSVGGLRHRGIQLAVGSRQQAVMKTGDQALTGLS